MCPSVRDQFYRLRKNEYGPTKEWVVLASSSAAPTAGAAKRTKEQKKKKAKKAKNQ